MRANYFVFNMYFFPVYMYLLNWTLFAGVTSISYISLFSIYEFYCPSGIFRPSFTQSIRNILASNFTETGARGRLKLAVTLDEEHQ